VTHPEVAGLNTARYRARVVDPFGFGWTFATHVKDMMASGSVGAGI